MELQRKDAQQNMTMNWFYDAISVYTGKQSIVHPYDWARSKYLQRSVLFSKLLFFYLKARFDDCEPIRECVKNHIFTFESRLMAKCEMPLFVQRKLIGYVLEWERKCIIRAFPLVLVQSQTTSQKTSKKETSTFTILKFIHMHFIKVCNFSKYTHTEKNLIPKSTQT